MNQVSWLWVAVALLGGGAMGAIIQTIVRSYQTRIQPIGKRIDLLPIFRASDSESSLSAEISISYEGNTQTFKNLFLAEIQVVNRGNKDFPDFKFGATLSGGDRCIYVETSPPDRHHKVEQESIPKPEQPTQEVDFSLKPFNRHDSYIFKLYVVSPEQHRALGAISLGSPSPIRFVDMPTMGELLAASVSEAAVKFGPLRVSLDR